MKKKIDATENPSRLENASARALSADRSEQASRPGTFSTMMSDRVIFSSASARIVAAEQVKGNKIAAMKPCGHFAGIGCQLENDERQQPFVRKFSR